MALYPVVLIDLSGGTAALKRTVLKRAHQTLMVTTPTLPSVRAARTLLQEIKELRGGEEDDVEVVVNMQNFAPKIEVPKAQIQEGLERSPVAVVPFDPGVFVGVESEATQLRAHKTGAPYATEILKAIQKTLSITAAENAEVEEKKGGLGQILTKLKTKS